MASQRLMKRMWSSACQGEGGEKSQTSNCYVVLHLRRAFALPLGWRAPVIDQAKNLQAECCFERLLCSTPIDPQTMKLHLACLYCVCP